MVSPGSTPCNQLHIVESLLLRSMTPRLLTSAGTFTELARTLDDDGTLECPCGNTSEGDAPGFGLCDAEGNGLPDSENCPGGMWVGHVKCACCRRFFFTSDEQVPADTVFAVLGVGREDGDA